MVITPSTTGTYTVTLYGNHSCSTTPVSTSVTFNVLPTPTVTPNIGVPSAICITDPSPYQISNATTGGSWGQIGTAVTIDDTGIPVTLSASSVGNSTVQYSVIGSNGCVGYANSQIYVSSAVLTLTGNGGSLNLCTGKPKTFTANIPNGVWSSSNAAVATVDQNGKVTGMSAGSVKIHYNVPASFCGTEIESALPLTILPTPSIVNSKSILTVCGTPFTFTANVSGGSWETPIGSGGDPSVATVASSGVVSPLKVGTTVVRYYPPNFTCLNDPIDMLLKIIPCNTGTPILCGTVVSTPIEGDGTADNNIVGQMVFKDGLFIISNDITIANGNSLVLENAQVIVEKDVKIKVGNLGNLKILGSHLYSCYKMWEGIDVIGDNAKVSITAYNGGSSLIEDAKVAISYTPDNPVPNYGGDKILDITNTIFNRNNIGIKISNFVDDYNGGELPFAISNCIFTSRAIPFDQNIVAWDNITSVKNTASITTIGQTPQVYAAPYIDDLVYTDNIGGNLHDIDVGEKPFAGILLENIGTKNSSGIYKSITIGATSSYATSAGINSNTNIFDNLQYGIKGENASVVVNNCTFQKPVGDGVGIWANSTFENMVLSGGNFVNKNIIKINTPAGLPNNAFFDMKRAVVISDIDDIEVSNCDIRSNQDVTNLSGNGEYGINIYNNTFSRIEVLKNKIYNIKNAINYGGGAEGGRNLFGILNINDNVIGKEISSTYPMPNGFIENAITASAFVESKYSNPVPLNVKKNIISNAYNGIWLSGFISKNFNVLENEIQLENDATIAPTGKHYGIKVDGGYSAGLQYELDAFGNVLLDANGVPVQTFGNKGENLIQENKIWGAGVSATDKLNAGIWLSQQSNTNIGCNHVWTSDNAYKFEGLCLLTKFMDNYIYNDNHYGYALYDGAQIGKQGQEVNSSATSDDICVSNNDFIDKSLWNVGSTPNKMTYTDNSDPNYSPLVIRTGSAVFDRFNPNGVGFSDPFLPSQIYSYGNGLITTTSTSDGFECERCATPPVPRRIKKSIVELMEEIAAGTTTIPNDQPFERLEVMQQQLYELVRARPEIAQNSSDIQQFIYDNQWSSLDFIYYAGYYASKGNMDMVNTLLNYWTPTNSEQDNNYYTYYEWLVAMYNNPEWKPNIDEVKTMAEKCPIKEGTVIYAARNLYNALTKEIHKFDNACDGTNSNARGVKEQVEMIRLKQPKAKPVIVGNQIVSIYPNPAKNIINIKGVNAKQIIVVDALGKVVIEQQNSSPFTKQLNISMLTKGIYLIKVIDNNNKTFTNKFIKE